MYKYSPARNLLILLLISLFLFLVYYFYSLKVKLGAYAGATRGLGAHHRDIGP